MADTISVQIRPGVTAFYQITGNPEDSNTGVVAVSNDPALVTTNDRLATINAKLPPLLNNNIPVVITQTNGVFSNRSGATSGTANTLTQLMAANANRTEWFIQNLSIDFTIELWFGLSGSEVLIEILDKGEKKRRSRWESGFSNADAGRWAVRSAGTNVSFAAHEIA